MLPLWILCGCRQFVKLCDSCSFSRAYCHLLGTNCFTFGVDFCSTNKVRSLFLLLILEILLKYYWKISRQQWALTNQPKQSSSRTKEWTWKRYGLFVLLGAETRKYRGRGARPPAAMKFSWDAVWKSRKTARKRTQGKQIAVKEKL